MFRVFDFEVRRRLLWVEYTKYLIYKMESQSKIAWKTREPYDESLNPFAEPRTSVAFSEELRNKLKQMGFGGNTSKPVGIEFDDIVAASFRIRKGVGKTPCEVILNKI